MRLFLLLFCKISIFVLEIKKKNLFNKTNSVRTTCHDLKFNHLTFRKKKEDPIQNIYMITKNQIL